MNMTNPSWTALVLDYLAQRLPQSSDDLLMQAVDSAPTEAIKRFLLHYRDIQLRELAHIDDDDARAFSAQAQGLRAVLEERAAEVVRLLQIDGLSPLPYAYLQFKTAEAEAALDRGLDDVEAAITCARKIGHRACEAFYLALKGEIIYRRRRSREDLEKAAAALTESRFIYEGDLADDHTYSRFGGITRTHLMRVRRQQFRYAKAKSAGERALELLNTNKHNFDEALATAERNLASVLRETGDLMRAERLCRSAVARLERRLGQLDRTNSRPDRYDRDEYVAQIALAKITQASILVKKSRLLRAKLERHRQLSQQPEQQDELKEQPDDSLRGHSNESLRWLKKAQVCLTSAAASFHRLPYSKQQAHSGGYAMLLYTNGQIHDLHGYTVEALQDYKAALAIWGNLEKSASIGEDKHYAAGARRRIGVVLRKAGQHEEAEQHFGEAAQSFHDLQMPLEEALVQCEWATLEEEKGQLLLAEKRYRLGIELCHQGLKDLPEHDYDVIFHWRLYDAYMWLVRQLAQTAEERELCFNESVDLVLYLESLRHFQTSPTFNTKPLSTQQPRVAKLQSATASQTDSPEEKDAALPQRHQIEQILRGDHPSCDRFKQNQAAFLWLQADRGKVIFVFLQHQRIVVGGSEPSLIHGFEALMKSIRDLGLRCRMLNQERRANQSETLKVCIDKQIIPSCRKLACSTDLSLGHFLFEQLPLKIQSLLGAQQCQLLFVSPCATTVSWPLELLRYVESDAAMDNGPALASETQAHHQNQDHYYDGYLGLHILMPRVQSLMELSEQILDRQPPQNGRCALLVGDPAHLVEQEPLLGADVKVFAKHLRQMQVQLLPDDQALEAGEVTKAAVLKALSHPNLCLWYHAGHGFGGGDSEPESYLPLANGEKLTLSDLEEAGSLQGAAIFLDCCHMGAADMHDSGRLGGFPPVLLGKGASCVLASTFVLHDDLCAKFAIALAAAIFHDEDCPNVGQAVLKARRVTYRQFCSTGHDDEHLLAWGLLTPWGNPFTVLQRYPLDRETP